MKRKIQHIFIFTILCISMSLLCISVRAYEVRYSKDTNADNEVNLSFEYYINDKGEAYLAGFTGDIIPETVIFPSEIDGIKIKGIKRLIISDNGDGQYVPVDLKGIKHLVISEGIQEINCILTGKENLETVVFPKSLERIVSESMRNAEKLKSINLENVKIIGSYAFYNCKSLKEVNLSSVTRIGIDAFGGVDNLKICAKYGSAAEAYAKDNGVFFIKSLEGVNYKSGIIIDGNTYYGDERTAMFLSKLGLMKGVSADSNEKIDFDLNRTGTRAEAVVMLVRMLGADKEAVNHTKTHPFTDVPEWADGYISYAYEEGLVKGISDTLFDSDSLVLPQMYLTFMLRVLGFSDTGENADFVWDNPWALAMKCGITPRAGYYQVFLRSEMVDQTYCTLLSNIKGSDTKLYEKLSNNGLFTLDFWNRGNEILNKSFIDSMNSIDSIYSLE